MPLSPQDVGAHNGRAAAGLLQPVCQQNEGARPCCADAEEPHTCRDERQHKTCGGRQADQSKRLLRGLAQQAQKGEGLLAIREWRSRYWDVLLIHDAVSLADGLTGDVLHSLYH
jgi:hypothetical protein